MANGVLRLPHLCIKFVFLVYVSSKFALVVNDKIKQKMGQRISMSYPSLVLERWDGGFFHNTKKDANELQFCTSVLFYRLMRSPWPSWWCQVPPTLWC